MIGHLHRQLASWGEDQNTRGPDFLRGKSSRCCNAGSRYAPFYRCLSAQNRVHHGHRAQRNGGSLNGGRASETFILEGFSRLSSSSSSEKVVTVMFYLLWGADYRRYGCNLHLFVWISFSGIVLTRCYRRFSCKVLFSVTVYIRASS